MKINDLELIQNLDGSFGRFHSMSSDSSITTEKALRRFLFLNIDKAHPVVKNCLEYVKKCLHQEIVIPDRREKIINWDVFEELMFSAWLNIFQIEDEKVTSIQLIWKDVIENSIINNTFDYLEYQKQYRIMFGRKGLKEINPSSFYMICLLTNQLNFNEKQAYLKYIMDQGIYYIYDRNLYETPILFDSKNTINYLVAIKLASAYTSSKEDLNFVKTWLYKNKSMNGYWEMPNLRPDGIVFPISDNWRRSENKSVDINNFINDILFHIAKEEDKKFY